MIKKLWPKVKKYLPWILAVILFLSVGAGLFYKQRLIKAELTQAVLIEKARILKSEVEYIRVKFKLLGDTSTVAINQWKDRAEAAESKVDSIQVKSAADIRAIRNQKGELQSRYDVLEFEALKMSDKVSAQSGLILALKGEITELHVRDNVRLEYIGELEGKIGECQRLLNISIANTNSILKKGWLFKLFGNIKIGPGGGFGIDGKGSIGIYVIWAVN